MEAPEVKQFDARTVISIEHTGSYNEIGDVYRRLYQWARDKNVKTTGPGLTIFKIPASEIDPFTAVYDICLPVDTKPKGDDVVTVKKLDACTVAYVTVKGPYSEIPGHYTELLAWLSVQGWDVVGHPREVYIKGPSATRDVDPSEFVTEIQFPVEQ